jgi:hypothetical protein
VEFLKFKLEFENEIVLNLNGYYLNFELFKHRTQRHLPAAEVERCSFFRLIRMLPKYGTIVDLDIFFESGTQRFILQQLLLLYLCIPQMTAEWQMTTRQNRWRHATKRKQTVFWNRFSLRGS